MVIVLPNEIDGLPSLLNKVAENGVLKDVFSIAPTGQEVLLDVPKFEVKTKLDLKKILPQVCKSTWGDIFSVTVNARSSIALRFGQLILSSNKLLSQCPNQLCVSTFD